MGWIHTGGGYYENEETHERIRGKANLPTDDGGIDEAASSTTKLPCMICDKMTAHTQKLVNSIEWAIYYCKECGGKTRVSLK